MIQDIYDKNATLAIFGGMVLHLDGWYDKDNILGDYVYSVEHGSPYSVLRFHQSFDWLFPVAKKFLSLENLEVVGDGRFLWFSCEIQDAIAEFNSQKLFETLYEAIVWYNKNRL